MRTHPFVLPPTLMALALVCAAGTASAQETPFSTGAFSLPEAIVPTPSGFGPSGTGYVVPDPSINLAGSGVIFAVPTAGGTASALVNYGTTFYPIGGTFLGASYGALNGDFLAVGLNSAGAVAQAVNGAGVSAPLLSSSALGQFNSAVIAPSGFGSIGGQALITDIAGNIDLLATTGTSTSVFAKLPQAAGATGVEPFGLGFAPAGFGSIGGDLLVSDGESANLSSVDANGNVNLFATIGLPNAATNGLRQFAFAPAGFGSYGGDLFVSVSGSSQGGGTFGEIVVLNDDGTEVADFDQGTESTPLDPRGLYFSGPDTLLISNGDPEILSVSAGNFDAVPEPSSVLILSVALALLPMLAKRQSRRVPMSSDCT
jgi:hypothetical protein